MVQSKTTLSQRPQKTKHKRTKAIDEARYKKLQSIGKVSYALINQLSSPIDSTNRFINLALQAMGENTQGRQFLLESKEGIRKTSLLLRKLNDNVRKIEKEMQEIAESNGSNQDTDSE